MLNSEENTCAFVLLVDGYRWNDHMGDYAATHSYMILHLFIKLMVAENKRKFLFSQRSDSDF